MSDREKAIDLISKIPDYKMYYVLSFLEGAAIPDEIPNADTLAAIEEGEQMIADGTGQHFSGSTEDFTNMLLGED